MKTKFYFILAVSAFLTFSCTKRWDYDFEDLKYGFNSEIHPYSNEFILMKVNDNTTEVKLKGKVEISCGSIEIEVIQPDGTIVFEKEMTENVGTELNKTFRAQKGYWKLKYESNGSQGFIDLYLNQ